MRRGLLFVAVLATITGAPSAATSANRPPIVATYAIVTHQKKPFPSDLDATLRIETFNPKTGAITGHGRAAGALTTMTGKVTGSAISMRVWAKGGPVARDKGTIASDGTITGTLRVGSGYSLQTGTWTMRRLATAPVVTDSGFTKAYHGQDTDVYWGLAIRNPSMTHDAVDVAVTVGFVGNNGRLIAGDPLGLGLGLTVKLPVIPAGQTVYLGDRTNRSGRVDVRGLRFEIETKSTPTKRHVLPPVSEEKVSDDGGLLVTATAINPYKTPISPYDYTATAAFYDKGGHIIGGDRSGRGGDDAMNDVAPGGSTPVEFLFGAMDPSVVASARVSVMPK